MFGLIIFTELNGNMISGLEMHENNEISELQVTIRQDPSFLNEFDNFPSNSIYQQEDKASIIPVEAEKKIQTIENDAIPTSTAQQQKRWMRKFAKFMDENNIEFENGFDQISKKELADLFNISIPN